MTKEHLDQVVIIQNNIERAEEVLNSERFSIIAALDLLPDYRELLVVELKDKLNKRLVDLKNKMIEA